MGILEMDFERILGVPFFLSSSHSIMGQPTCKEIEYNLVIPPTPLPLRYKRMVPNRKFSKGIGKPNFLSFHPIAVCT